MTLVLVAISYKRLCVFCPCALAMAVFWPSAYADLPSTVEKLKPSVVLVGTFDPLGSPRFVFRGTGFVVGTGNQVLTNAHVLPASNSSGVSARLAIQVWGANSAWSPRMAVVAGRDVGCPPTATREFFDLPIGCNRLSRQ